MSLKFVGVLIILAAGALLFLQIRRQNRAEVLFMRDMAAALEQMETAIRFRRLPMPDMLKEQEKRQYCGQAFAYVIQYMKSGKTLQDSWELSMKSILCERARDVLSALELSGDTQRLEENLRSASHALRDILRRTEAGRQEQQKMTLALTASGCGLLVILLL